MPDAPIRAYFDEAADILVNIPPQVTFSHVLAVDDFPEAVNLAFAQLVHPGRHHCVQVGFSQYLFSNCRPYAVNAA
jgi:hypothetical protein